nr:hypothetical protein [Streptomyces sp. SID5468]
MGLAAAVTVAGCGGQGGHRDCASVAAAVRSQADALPGAARKAGDDPREAATVLRTIQQDLDEIAGKTPGPAAGKAVAELSQAVANAKDQLDKGEPVEVAPVQRGAADLVTACPKG